MATHASILAGKPHGQRSLAGLQAMGLQRVGCTWVRVCTHTQPPLKQTTEIKQKFIANNVTKEIRNHKEHSINPK